MAYHFTLEYQTNQNYDDLATAASDLEAVSAVDADDSATVVGNANLNLTDLGPRLRVEIEKKTPADAVTASGDDLANKLVAIGLESSVEEAAEAIDLRA
jgi:hypothetical protein